MWGILFWFVIHSQYSLAAPQKIVVMGVELLADHVEYFAGTNTIASFDVIEPVIFPLPRGNSISAAQSVYLHKNGMLSLVSSPNIQNIVWKTANGDEVKLNCSFRPANFENPKSSRLIRFYENGEYLGGCASDEGTTFTDNAGNIISAFGDLEVSPSFKLLYAKKVGDSFIQVNSNKIHLLAGTEIAFYQSGKPKFFTMIHAEQFTVNHAHYGTLIFGQKEGKHVSTSLFEDGTVERGILKQDLLHSKTGINILADSGVSFAAPQGEIDYIKFNVPTPIQAKGYLIQANNFSIEKGYYTLFVAAEFIFKHPQTGADIFVPAGSQVALSEQMEIIGIRIPKNG